MTRRLLASIVIAVVGIVAGLTVAAWWAQTQGDGDDNPSPASSPSTAPRTPVPSPPPGRSPAPSPPPDPAATASPGSSEADFSRHTYVLTFASSPWVVVNKERPIMPLDYEPDDLETLTGVPGGGDQQLRSEAAADFLAMYEQARGEGITIRVTTAYRGYGFQQGLFQGYVQEWGVKRAETFVARPGFSEHQTGWAVDVFDTEACRLNECFADSPVYEWIVDNAAGFGFIVRYPDGFQDITGYRFEPWHLRWVGADLAQQMRVEGIETMEDFFDLPSAPDYRE